MMSVVIGTTSTEPRNRVWYTKMLEYARRNRSRVDPLPCEIPNCEFFSVSPRRTLRVIRPELKSGSRFYEPQKPSDRPESMNDNFYSRWARRPHPSGDCRCSFRQSASSSSRLSTHEELIISQEIQRIRTSLCEAERSGRGIEELEKTLGVDLGQLAESEEQKRIEPLEESAKKRIVKDLDRYISDLLDEILNDTIRAIAQAEQPFERRESAAAATAFADGSKSASSFDINFEFPSGSPTAVEQAADDEAEDGQENRGFVGSANDPDALDFQLRRHRFNDREAEAIGENATDCIDSGINSVETIELQQQELLQQNLEQSLIDIIDAKLGGSSIGKSLEDLGMEIDDEASVPTKRSSSSSSSSDSLDNGTNKGEGDEQRASSGTCAGSMLETKVSPAREEERRPSDEAAAAMNDEAPVDPITTRTPACDKSRVIEQQQQQSPPFDSLRLEFKRPGSSSNASSKQSEEKQQPAAAAATASRSNVTWRVNKTVAVIRRRIARRLRRANCHQRRKSQPANKSTNAGGVKSSGSSAKLAARIALELEDYRRRFPVPDLSRSSYNCCDNNDKSAENAAFDPSGELVTLRNRKPTIVFLHGFGSSADAFEPQLRYFSELGYPCVAPDLLGHGMSSAPNRAGDYQFEKLLRDLEAVLQRYAFKPGQKCVLVAHNYGCSFATALAYKYVHNVHQMVLISGGGPTPLAPPLSEGAGHCCLRASLAPFLVCGMHRAVLYSARGRQHPYCGAEQHEDQWPSHMRYVLKGMSWPEGDYVFHRRICTPTLLVHGLRDNKVSLVQECQMERTMVKAFLEAIPAAGHLPMTDCPEQLNHMIHCFIDLWKNKKW